MRKLENAGLKGLSGEGQHLIAKIIGQEIGAGTPFAAILTIAHKPMTDMGHVHPDLVRPPGFEPAFHLGKGGAIVWPEAGKPAHMGYRVAGVGPVGNGHFQPVVGIAGQGRVDRELRAGPAPHKGRVEPLQIVGLAVIGELCGEVLVGGIGLGHHHHAGRVLVQPVNDAGAFHTANAGQALAAVKQERIDQRAGRVAGAWMHHQTCRLVDDDEVGVLVQDVERDVFRLWLRFFSFGNRECDGFFAAQLLRRIGEGIAVQRGMAGLDERRDTAARQAGRLKRSKRGIQPLAAQRGRCLKAQHVLAVTIVKGLIHHVIVRAVSAARPDEEEPLDPRLEAVAAKMRRLSLVSSLIMFVGIFAVLGVILYRSLDGGSSGYAEPIPADQVRMLVASGYPGATIETVGGDERSILVGLTDADGPIVVEIDRSSWQVVGTIRFAE